MGKNKDPAVLFYPSDFLASTSLWTNEQLGMYIKLLCLQFLQDGVSNEDIETVCGDCTKVKEKFVLCDDGSYRNPRMALEKEKRIKFTESRRANINKRYERCKATTSEELENIICATSVEHMKNICSTSVLHMGNENININKDISIPNNIFSFSNNNNNIEMIKSASAREMENENDVVYMASDGPVTRKKLKELALESQFESQVREYFKGQYFDKDSSEPSPFISNAELFIIYNRERGWKGHGGIDLTKDDRWVAYADEWERKERLKK